MYREVRGFDVSKLVNIRGSAMGLIMEYFSDCNIYTYKVDDDIMVDYIGINFSVGFGYLVELEDEWFIFNFYDLNNSERYYQCDQFEGLERFLYDFTSSKDSFMNRNYIVESSSFKDRLYYKLSDVDVDDMLFNFTPYGLENRSDKEIHDYYRSIGHTEFSDREFQEIEKLSIGYSVCYMDDYRMTKVLPRSIIMGVDFFNKHSWSIEKFIDDWYYLLDDDDGSYYKCDQFDGLCQCIRDVIL